jgi:ABC-type transport system involved in multi-copper enzyme maturation permease subunit
MVLFGILLLGMSTLMTALSGEEPVRILLDFGLVTIELFALFMTVFTGVNIILEEMNSKTIYLVLARPVPRWYYLIGKYLGLLSSVYASMVIMAVIHVVLLFYKGWIFDPEYILAIFCSGFKIAIIGSLAIFFSLFSTSAVSSLVFTFLMWVLGHFSSEIKFMIDKLTSLVPKLSLTVLYYIIPDLTYFNWRDFLGIYHPGLFTVLPISVLYGILYSTVFLLLAVVLFNRKEF